MRGLLSSEWNKKETKKEETYSVVVVVVVVIVVVAYTKPLTSRLMSLSELESRNPSRQRQPKQAIAKILGPHLDRHQFTSIAAGNIDKNKDIILIILINIENETSSSPPFH